MRCWLAAPVCLAALSTSALQAQVVVDVEYNGSNAFHDQASNTTSDNTGNLAITRIHEGDTVQFVWPGAGSARNHNVFPYDATVRASGSVSVSASTVMTLPTSTSSTFTSSWDALTRSRRYQCTLHRLAMNGVIYVYEIAQSFAVTGPSAVVAGEPFTVTVTAAGTGNGTDALYAGTVHFGSGEADAGMQFPADYTFNGTDSGTHTFTGVILTAPGPRTITVSERGGGITAQFALNVSGCRTHYSFGNSAAISIPGSGAGSGIGKLATAGRAAPFPSVINVSGATGRVAHVAVTLLDVSHQRPADVDALLVGPAGQKMVILSDVPVPTLAASSAAGAGAFAAPPVSLTLTDTPAVAVSSGSVTARPTNFGSSDAFPSPAPSPPYRSPAPAGTATFASVFAGSDPNGAWRLFVVDDTTASTGRIATGWRLTLDTICP